jgi:hypothetical protein
MKTKLLFLVALIFATMNVFCQDVLVGWTFPLANMTDSIADQGLPMNKNRVVKLSSDSMIMFINTTGSPAPCAQAMGLTNGTVKQYGWNISFSTKGYKDLKLSSMQAACPMHSGPKYWKAQFKIGGMGVWTDIPGGKIECVLGWNSAKAKLDNVSIPSTCNDNPLIFVRWIMTSDSNVTGSSMGTDIVDGGSMSRIDNISISGTKILTEGDTLVGWTFPNALMSDTIANLGLPVNKTKVIKLKAAMPMTMLTKTSFSPPACAQAMGMSNATAMEKGWYIEFDATHYKDLKVFSRQHACPTHSGPKYWKIQYKVGAGSWTDVPGGNITCALNWVKSAVTALLLPADCNGAAQLGLRWITTSDSNVAGATLGTPIVSDTSMTRIDDVIITGNLYNDIDENIPQQVFEVYPNPASGMVNIMTDSRLKEIIIYNSFGQQIFSDKVSGKITLDFGKFGKGLFIVRLQDNYSTLTEKLIIQ